MKKFLIIALLLIPSFVSAYQDGANWAYGTLTSAMATDAATFTVTNGTYSSAFPTTNFTVVVFSSTCSTPSLCSTRELILVTSRSSNTFTISARDQEGTTHTGSWAAGSKVWYVITEARLDELQETAGSYTAADIANVPAGTIAGDDVQEALNELDTEKVNTSDVIALDKGGTGQALVDPDASTLIGWDDTDGAVKFITIGTGLTYTAATDTLSISGATTGDVVGPAGDVATDNGVFGFLPDIRLNSLCYAFVYRIGKVLFKCIRTFQKIRSCLCNPCFNRLSCSRKGFGSCRYCKDISDISPRFTPDCFSCFAG